jgi:hypothetical protein
MTGTRSTKKREKTREFGSLKLRKVNCFLARAAGEMERIRRKLGKT